MSYQILVVDDQVSICHHIHAILENEGYGVGIAHSGDQALSKLSSHPYDLLLADMKMPGMDGLELFHRARKMEPNISGIIMTAYASISSAVKCIKKGINDYLVKPFEPESLLLVVEKAFREREMLREIRDLRKEVNQKYAFGNIIGKNYKMQAIYDLIKKVSPTDARVFIHGETGVGKELVAKAIHFNSRRKNRAFVGINCGALAESLLETELFGHEKGAFTGAIRKKAGKFEYARGGTLFLDEIGDISPRMQVRLLRVLQEKKVERVGGNESIDVDVRLLSATNQDIKEKVARGEFRVELFYRLNVVPIHIPPLRERIEDIPLLVKHFMDIFNRNLNKNIMQISVKAMEELMQYHWPGNVRELENVLERAFVTTDGDTIDSVIFSLNRRNTSFGESLVNVDVDVPFFSARSVVVNRFEKAYLFEALKRYKGNVSKAAKETGVNPRTFWRKINSYGLDYARLRPKKNRESHVRV
ncbi:MAG: sigma-54-dependent Fis family transcriptional regulator [Deltaproteobacteria bacterium]|nr:sigma-54-dependent Fis family transcriptional regulator [Deltaproteobacteria bacterium]